MNDCKFCGLLAGGDLAAKLPNLVIETPTAVVAVNRRPHGPGHLTLMLKRHHTRTSEMQDANLAGVGDLLGRLAGALERLHSPGRVVLLGDGKRSAHVHLHLIPEPTAAPLDLGAVVTDLNLSVRPPTLSDAETAATVKAVRAALNA